MKVKIYLGYLDGWKKNKHTFPLCMCAGTECELYKGRLEELLLKVDTKLLCKMNASKTKNGVEVVVFLV